MKSLKLLLVLISVILLPSWVAGQTSQAANQMAKARELAGQGKNEEASGIFREMMGKYPANKDVVKEWLMLNMKRSPTGEQEAIGQLEELQKSYPDNLAILFWKMFLMMEYNKTEEALKIAEKLVILQPDTALNWLAKGQILESMNNLDKAFESYNKAVILGPDNPDAWQNRAGLYAKTKKTDQAILDYSVAIRMSPRIANFVYNRGCLYCLKGEKAKALADLAKAVSMDPKLKSHAMQDADFASLREDPEFRKIVAEEKYSIPLLEANQKHGRVLGQAWTTDAAAINFAKSKGVNPYEFGCYVGKLFATTWGTDRSFDRLIKGSIFNIETFRHVSDTPIEVTENQDGSVSILTSENMWHKYFTSNNQFASFSEFMDFSRGIFGEIAAYMESDLTMEITNAKVIFTFRKK